MFFAFYIFYYYFRPFYLDSVTKTVACLDNQFASLSSNPVTVQFCEVLIAVNVACEVGPTWQFILLYNIEQQSTGLGSIIPTAALISYLVGRLFKAYSDQYLLINKERRSYIFRVLGWGRLYLS